MPYVTGDNFWYGAIVTKALGQDDCRDGSVLLLGCIYNAKYDDGDTLESVVEAKVLQIHPKLLQWRYQEGLRNGFQKNKNSSCVYAHVNADE